MFLSVLLPGFDHWFCVVINLVDKRMKVLDLMNLKCEEKMSAIANVVTTFIICRAMVLSFVQIFEFKCHFVMYLFCWGHVSTLFNVLKRTRPLSYPWKNWIIHHPDVPQQSNMWVYISSLFSMECLHDYEQDTLTWVQTRLWVLYLKIYGALDWGKDEYTRIRGKNYPNTYLSTICTTTICVRDLHMLYCTG